MAVVRGGGVVAYPTDTVWGLGGDARRPDVVARVRALKGRDRRPMLVLADGLDRVRAWVRAVPAPLNRVLRARLAATVLLPASPAAPGALVGEEGWIGVRCPGGWTGAVCERLGVPLLSTSANRSGQSAPTARERLADEIVAGVDLVVAGPEPSGTRPSTLVRMDGGEIVVVRPGAVGAAALEQVSGAAVRRLTAR